MSIPEQFALRLIWHQHIQTRRNIHNQQDEIHTFTFGKVAELMHSTCAGGASVTGGCELHSERLFLLPRQLLLVDGAAELGGLVVEPCTPPSCGFVAIYDNKQT